MCAIERLSVQSWKNVDAVCHLLLTLLKSLAHILEFFKCRILDEYGKRSNKFVYENVEANAMSAKIINIELSCEAQNIPKANKQTQFENSANFFIVVSSE